MKENKLSITINKSIDEVFEFTINPKNTPLWITHLKEELADTYPPHVGTLYKNTGDFNKWYVYEVTEFKKDKTFTMKAADNNYYVRYTYKNIDNTKTEMEYFEWVEKGELDNPFTQSTLEKLKEVIERQDFIKK